MSQEDYIKLLLLRLDRCDREVLWTHKRFMEKTVRIWPGPSIKIEISLN